MARTPHARTHTHTHTHSLSLSLYTLLKRCCSYLRKRKDGRGRRAGLKGERGRRRRVPKHNKRQLTSRQHYWLPAPGNTASWGSAVSPDYSRSGYLSFFFFLSLFPFLSPFLFFSVPSESTSGVLRVLYLQRWGAWGRQYGGLRLTVRTCIAPSPL